MEHEVIHLGPFGTLGGRWGPLWARKWPKHASNHQIFHETNTQFPIVDLSHSAILYLNFSWNNRSSIWDHLGPWGGRWGPLQARKRPKHASNHQIFLCPHSMHLTPSFTTVRSSQSKMFYLDFSWNIGSSIWDHWGPWNGALGAPLSQTTTKTCLKSSDILLSAFHETYTQFF